MSESRNKEEVSVIVPLFNEENNVSLMFSRLKTALEKLKLSYEIIFVDDGSTDNTYQILKELKSENERIIIIKFSKNFGQSSAIFSGFNIASGDYAVTIDGDLQYDPEDIISFFDEIKQGADVVCSLRQIDNLHILIKRVPSLVANYIGNFMFGLKVHDFSCSFRAYKKDFYKNLYQGEGFHRFIPVLAKFQGLLVKEVKVKYFPRKNGVSKYSFLRFPKVIKDAIFFKLTDIVFNKSCKHLFKKVEFTIDDIIR